MLRRALVRALARTADIDFVRLHHAITDHGLDAAYREIWGEAFPGEPPPGVD